MNKFFFAAAMITAAAASGAQPGKLISSQTLTARIYPHDLHCVDGKPGPFPLRLSIELNVSYGSAGFYYPSDLMLQNVKEAHFFGAATEKCADYQDVLSVTGPVTATITKTISERALIRPDNGRCQRDLYEEMKIGIGRLKLEARKGFVIYPAPSTDCAAAPN